MRTDQTLLLNVQTEFLKEEVVSTPKLLFKEIGQEIATTIQNIKAAESGSPNYHYYRGRLAGLWALPWMANRADDWRSGLAALLCSILAHHHGCKRN